MVQRKDHKSAALLLSCLSFWTACCCASNAQYATDSVTEAQTIKPDDSKVQQLTRPAANEALKLGHTMWVEPYMVPAAYDKPLRYMLADMNNTMRLIGTDSVDWCATGVLKTIADKSRWKLLRYQDGSAIQPGRYRLVITRLITPDADPSTSRPLEKVMAKSAIFSIISPSQ